MTTHWMDVKYTSKQQIIQAIQAVLSNELHDASDHRFQRDHNLPGNSGCAVCGWLNPDGPKLACGETVRNHLENMLKDLKGRDGNGTFEILKDLDRRQLTKALLTSVIGVIDLHNDDGSDGGFSFGGFLAGFWPF